MKGAKITAIGTYVPAKRLTNADLEQIVDTNNEWIVQRTGIRERRISRQDEYTSDLCAAAIAGSYDSLWKKRSGCRYGPGSYEHT